GGAGFIGSHLCERLLSLEHEVICVDNLITGSEKNIHELNANPKFDFLRHDVTQPLPEKIDAQVIFHLASPASPNKNNPKSYINFPIETLLVNSLGTYQILELAKNLGAKFLYASSSEIYGNPLKHPQKESHLGNVSSLGPRSCYDEAKRFGEAMTMAFFRKHGLDVRIIRIFNTFGPKMADDGRVVVTFILQALKGEPITIFGDGSQTRSPCYVSDLVEGLIKAMESPKTNGEVFNLGNPEEYDILKLANLIKRLTNSKSELTYFTLPEDDPERRCPDITKAKEILGWKPQVTVEDGILKTIAYLKTQRGL
ncbi:MAG: SDR family oxidoreductase, partial [bacterium]|nr:SDR family oxidoreductase [bacterium]